MKLLRFLLMTCVAGLSVPARGIEIADPTYAVENMWSVRELGLPAWNLHGMVFEPDGELLFVVISPGINICGSTSQLWSLQIDRAPETDRIVELFDPERVFDAVLPCLGSGWETGPEGTLFYTYPGSQTIAERPGGFDGVERQFGLSALRGRPESGGLTFSPHLFDVTTGFGVMQTCSWTLSTHEIHNIYLEPLDGGAYRPVEAELFASRPGPAGQDGIAGQLQYILSGPNAGDLLYANFNSGQVMLMAIDKETGLAIDRPTGQPLLGTRNPVVEPFVVGLGVGPYSLEFDPLSGHLFVGTMTGGGTPADSIIQIRGFPRPERHPEGPTAAFVLEMDGEQAPAKVDVDASQSKAPEGSLLASLEWDFGDGGSAEGTTAGHTYDEPGRYIVTLTVTDSEGRSRQAARGVSVDCAPDDLDPWEQRTLGGAVGGATRATGTDGCFALCTGGEIGLPFGDRSMDSFLQVYQSTSGDVVVEAQVTAIEEREGAKAGVFVRGSSTSPTGVFAAMMVEYRRGHSFAFLYRDGSGDRVARIGRVAELPAWVQLRRIGDDVVGLASLDGETWIEVGRVAVRLSRSRLLAGVAAAGGDRRPLESFPAARMEVCGAAVRTYDAAAEPEAVAVDPLWLSDIVAAGDGATPPPASREEQEILALDIDTGVFAPVWANRGTFDADGVNPSPVEDSAWLDSVFFLDREVLPVNSAGAEYHFDPLQVTGRSWNHILSNVTHDLSDGIRAGDRDDLETCVGIHASAGVTFDLAALREDHGAEAVHSLTAYLGLDAGLDGCQGGGLMTLFIIYSNEEGIVPDRRALEGEAFSFRTGRGVGEFYEAVIPPEATFVSLVSGAANGDIGCDYGVFGDARIWPRPPGGHRGPRFVRGDPNGDGRSDISDGVAILNFLFSGGDSLACQKSADANDSGTVDISDGVYVLNHLFVGGPPPPDPASGCGEDPTPDELPCETPPSCLQGG